MKKNYAIFILTFLMFFSFENRLFAQAITEGFESTTPPPAGWTYNSVTHGTNNPRSGSRCATFNANNDAIITPLISNPAILTFYWRRSSTAPTSPVFQVFTGTSTTGPWTQIGSNITSFTTTYQTFTFDLTGQTNIYIRVLHTRSAGTNEVYIDDFSVTAVSGNNYYWNGSNTTALNGTWDNATTNWSNPTATTTVTSIWPNTGTTNVANFNSAASSSTVTLPGTIASVPQNINIGTSNYTFATTGTTAGATSSNINLNANTLTFAPISAAGLNLSGVISGTGAITQNGAGITTLSGTNTYTGGNTISAGTLSISTDLNLGAAPGAATPGSITLNGGTLQSTSAAVILSANRGIALGTSGGTIDITASNALTYGGIIAGTTGTLTKSNTGTLTLSGANTYEDATILSNGTLRLGAATGSTSSGPLGKNTGGTTVNAGATIDLNGLAFTASPNETITLNGTGVSNNGALVSNTGSATWTRGSVVLGSDSHIGGTGNVSFVGTTVVSGANSLTKVGAGNLDLSGAANTFGGAGKSITVAAGTVTISTDANLGDASNTFILGTASTSGKLSVSNGATTTISKAFSVAAGGGTIEQTNNNHITFSGSGTLSTPLTTGPLTVIVQSLKYIDFTGLLSGTGGINVNAVASTTNWGVRLSNTSNTFTGDITVNSGNLVINANEVIPDACKIILNGGSLFTQTNTETMGVLKLTNNSSIQLGASGSITFDNSAAEPWTTGKMLTINGWLGTYGAGTAGTGSRIFVSGAAGLTCDQLDQIQFFNGTTNFPAANISGELVPILTPTTTTISPSSATEGAAGFTITVNGTNFISGLSKVTWAGEDMPTTFVSSTQLTATVAASYVAIGTAGTVQVGVKTQCRTSNTQPFTINPSISITTTTASYGPFCNVSGNTISVAFTSSGTFSGNFFVQLSDASGNFPANSTDNLISSGSATSPISATIPAAQAAGTGYRVRVVNPTPAIQSSNNNGSNITVTAASTPTVSIAITSGTNPTCAGSSVTFTATPANLGGGSVGATSYQWKKGGTNISGATSSTYTTTTLGNNDVISCAITVTGGCVTSTSATTTSDITMTVNAVVTPAVSIAITSGTNPMCSNATITFTATPTNGGTTPGYQWKKNGTNAGTLNSVTYSPTSGTLAQGDVITCVMTSTAACPSPATATATGITMTINTPTTQAAAPAFANVNVTQMDISGSRGNGSNLLIIARAGAAPTDPSNGTSYTANSIYGTAGTAVGSGFAVFNANPATTYSATITNLSAQTQYYFSTYEYGTGPCYNLTENTSSRWTLSLEPTAHGSFTNCNPVSSAQIDLSFSAASGITNADGYIILQKAGSAPTGTPNDATAYSVGNAIGDATVAAIVNSTSATSQSITGLNGSTDYYFILIPFNWNGSQAQTYNYRTSATIPSTNCTTLVPTFQHGDFRTTNIGTWSYNSTTPGTTVWEKYNSSTGVFEPFTGQPNTSPEYTAYITKDTDIPTNATVHGRAKIIVLRDPVTNVAPTLTFNVSNEWTFRGIQIKEGATMQLNTKFAVLAGSNFEIEDGGNFIFNYSSNGNPASGMSLWNGNELFHPESNFYVNDHTANSGEYFLPTATDMQSNIFNGGVDGYFGNLMIQSNDAGGFRLTTTNLSSTTKYLTHKDLIFTTKYAYSLLFGSGTWTIGRDLKISSTSSSNTLSLTTGANAITLNVKRHLIKNGDNALRFSNNAGANVTINVDGNVEVNSGTMDLNFAAGGQGKLNLKGNLSVASAASLFATAQTTAGSTYPLINAEVNFNGTYNSSDATTIQTIDNAASGNATKNSRINFNVNTGAYVQLKTQDLQLGTRSMFIVKATGGTTATGGVLDFGFNAAGTTALNVTSGAATTTFFNLGGGNEGGTLKITSPQGISATSGTVGNVQVTNAPTYNDVSTFWYIGNASQQTGTGLPTGSSAKIVICDLTDNAYQLTLSGSDGSGNGVYGVSNTTTLSATGGKLDIRKGQVIETENAYFGNTGGTLYMSPGTLYKIVKCEANESGAGSNDDAYDNPIPRMSGGSVYNPYVLTGGTIELAGSTAGNFYQVLRGQNGLDDITYYDVKFSGTNTLGTNFKGIPGSITVSNSLYITENAIVDCRTRANQAASFEGNGGLIMDGGLLRIKKLNTTNPELKGINKDYNLTGGTIEFYGSEATQQQQIRGNYKNGTKIIEYYNLEINADAANYSSTDRGNVDMSSSFTLKNTMNVNSPAVFKMDETDFIWKFAAGSSDNVNIKSGAGLMYGSPFGITTFALTGAGTEASSGASDAPKGNIRTSSRTFDANASYGFVGSGNMLSGSALPATVDSLYVYKSNPSDRVTLTNPVSADYLLKMSSGHIITGSNYIGIGTSTTAVGTLSYTSGYVVGNMRRYFANSTNSGNATGLFPLGQVVAGGVIKNRFYKLEYTAVPTPGYLDVNFNPVSMGFAGIASIPAIPAVTGCSTFNVTSTSFQGYWIATPAPDKLGDGVYTLSLTGEDIVTINSLCELTLLKRVQSVGPNWTAPGTHIKPSGSTSMPTVSRSGITGFSNFGFGGGAPNYLPVELTSFTGTCLEDGISQISWSTATEFNSKHFIVQRSEDGIRYTDVATVPAAGFSSQPRNYSITDTAVNANSSYYRLLEVDNNNQQTIYSFIQVKCNEVNGMHIFYAQPKIAVELVSTKDKPVSFNVFEISGKLIYQENRQIIRGYNRFDLGLKNVLADGIYIIQMVDGDNVNSTKVMVR